MTFRTRFAPSPTGPLHLGHAFSALTAADLATQNGGEFLLRIEDIDQSRARSHWETQIIDDLTWLGLDWPIPARRQSEHLSDYTTALQTLHDMGLTYPCACNRRDIAAATTAPQENRLPTIGPDGRVYPGTCRSRTTPGPHDALRLNMEKALNHLSTMPEFVETGPAHLGRHRLGRAHMLEKIGDVVLSRPAMGTSYHLAVTLDDAAQNITHVVRGKDLFDATAIHVLLQALLGLPTPRYHHHRLIRDDTGKRLAKRDDARALQTYRHQGLSPHDIHRLVGL